MPFTLSNETDRVIPFRIGGVKRFIEPGAKAVLDKDAHADAARDAGLTVDWVQSHRDIIAAAEAEDVARDEAIAEAEEPKPKPRRKATVTVSED